MKLSQAPRKGATFGASRSQKMKRPLSVVAVFAIFSLIWTIGGACYSRSCASTLAPGPGPATVRASWPWPWPWAPAPAPSPTPTPADDEMVFDVTEYGAVGDGKTENSKAFLAAWSDACNYTGLSKLVVPKGVFFIGPVSFMGPCYNHQSPKVVIQGILKAPTKLSAFPDCFWIMFYKLNGLTLTGEGTASSLIDAQGEESWENPGNGTYPISLKLVNITNGEISHFTLKDAKGFNMGILNTDRVIVHDINISAPGDSPNTDGIHSEYSTNIDIVSSTIGVGDDCVSIGPGSINLTISDIKCGPGHGISVGSLGKYLAEEDVAGITVQNCTLNSTSNGIRIKTWPGSPASKASSFLFDNIHMINVSYPIIIDQYYCPHSTCNTTEPSSVQLKDISFYNIRGTFNSKSAVALWCSSSTPCENVNLHYVNLTQTVASTLQAGGTSFSVKGSVHGLDIHGSAF